MKRFMIIISLLVFAMCISGCGSKGIKAPKGSEQYKGAAWKTVYDEFANAGFTNISTKEVKDIAAESAYEDGGVESVSINGETNYPIDTEYPKEAEVVITYHSLAEFKVNLHVKFIGNLLFNKYDVSLMIDEESQTTMKHGEDKDLQLELVYGKHTITFAKEDDPEVNGQVTLNVASDVEAAYTIYCEGDYVSVTEDYVDYKIELAEGQAKFSKSSDEFSGNNYEKVVAELEGMGFANIKTEPVYDIYFGVTEDGTLANITVDGQDGFKRGEIHDANAEIIVRYHTLYENDPELIAEKQKEEEERKAEEERLAEEARKIEEERLAEEARVAEEENQTLTIENCEELAQILASKASSEPAYVEFANKYAGRKIEFDGRIDYLTNHGNYDTRYDILVSAGDYDPDTQSGPNFKFEDVSFSDLHSDLESVYTGLNLHIIAYVGEFDSQHEIFYLEPVEVTGR